MLTLTKKQNPENHRYRIHWEHWIEDQHPQTTDFCDDRTKQWEASSINSNQKNIIAQPNSPWEKHCEFVKRDENNSDNLEVKELGLELYLCNPSASWCKNQPRKETEKITRSITVRLLYLIEDQHPQTSTETN